MDESWQNIVKLHDGMVLGAKTWLEPLARNIDLAYGMAHRPSAAFAQSWWGAVPQGVTTVWDGETSYDARHLNLNFSAWVDIPGPDASQPYVILQLYYASNWHDFITDTAEGSHWFDEAEAVDGIVSKDISAYYQPGDVIRARVQVQGDGNVAGTSAWIYRACLGGFDPEWPDDTDVVWPNPMPSWQGTTPHTEADFNALREAAEYLRQCAQAPLVGEAIATSQHFQAGAEEEVARWSFRKDGCDKLTAVIVTTGCSDTQYVHLYLAEEQEPHGPGTFAKTQIAAITTDTTTTVSYDMSALTMGNYYCVILGTVDGVKTQVTSLHTADLAGELPAHQPGSFAHKDVVTVAQMQTITDALTDLRPSGISVSPLWYEHTFSTYRPGDGHQLGPGRVEYTGRRMRFQHADRYLRYRGAWKLVSDDGLNSYNLSDSNPPGAPQLLDLRTLAWMAEGDWYYLEDADGAGLTAYEDWQA